MKTIILAQRKERDELMSRPYLIRKSSPKTEKWDLDSIIESAGGLKFDNLVIVTYRDKRPIEKDGYKIDVVPITEF